MPKKMGTPGDTVCGLRVDLATVPAQVEVCGATHHFRSRTGADTFLNLAVARRHPVLPSPIRLRSEKQAPIGFRFARMLREGASWSGMIVSAVVIVVFPYLRGLRPTGVPAPPWPYGQRLGRGSQPSERLHERAVPARLNVFTAPLEGLARAFLHHSCTQADWSKRPWTSSSCS